LFAAQKKSLRKRSPSGPLVNFGLERNHAMNELADFNTYARGFGTRMFLVAGRVFDLAPDNFAWLACAWYERHGLLELPGDRYIGKLPGSEQEAVRYNSVDELVLNPPKELVGIGRHIYDGWLAKKAQLDKIRNADPIVILPPPPEPPKPTKPTPVELPPKEEPVKKNPNPTLVRFSVYFGMIASVAGIVAWFIPGAKPWVAAIVPIIKTILSLFGV
jgi:hypothetical protein